MRPPICDVCDKKLEENQGGLVYFKRRPSDIEWDERVEREHLIGHPPYAAWFCGEHIEKAREFSDLAINEAMARIK